jgi:hypothetical protein
LFHFIQFLFAFEESVFAEQQKVANHLWKFPTTRW